MVINISADMQVKINKLVKLLVVSEAKAAVSPDIVVKVLLNDALDKMIEKLSKRREK